MINKMFKIFAVMIVLSCIFNILSPIYAKEKKSSSLLDTIFGTGGKWFKNNVDDKSAQKDAQRFTDLFTQKGGIVDTIKAIGYLVFFIFGAILGVKYMISGVEGKTFVKEGLVGYCVGAVMFYLADQVFTFVYNIFVKNISSTTNYTGLSSTIWATFSNVIGIVIVAVVVIYGLKYMWASPDKQASLKKGMVPMLIGAILVLCTLQILKFVVNITKNTIGNDTTYLDSSNSVIYDNNSIIAMYINR